jgi:hypothetical protein
MSPHAPDPGCGADVGGHARPDALGLLTQKSTYVPVTVSKNGWPFWMLLLGTP